MIQVIASIGCSKCKQTKIRLDKEDIKYSYRFIDELNDDTADRYMDMAKEVGQQNFPIIIKNNEIVSLEDVLDG